jgi:hypothetical protein
MATRDAKRIDLAISGTLSALLASLPLCRADCGMGAFFCSVIAPNQVPGSVMVKVVPLPG